MTKMMTAVHSATAVPYPASPATLHRKLTLADAQAALNRVRGIKLTAALLRHLPALVAVIDRGGVALLPSAVLRETAIALGASGAGVADLEAEAFAIVGVACTYGRATGQIGKPSGTRELALTLDDEGLHLAAAARHLA